MKNQNGKQKHTMNIVLAVIAAVLIIFTVAMVITYWHVGGVPDILITSVFAACLGECGFMAWIKNTKQRTGGYDNDNNDDAAGNLIGFHGPGDGSSQKNDWK